MALTLPPEIKTQINNLRIELNSFVETTRDESEKLSDDEESWIDSLDRLSDDLDMVEDTP